MQLANQLLAYANAIFAVAANDKQAQEKYYQQISALDALNAANIDFYNILSSRIIDKNERKEFAKEILSGLQYEDNVIYWVWAIIDNNYYVHFHNIAKICKTIYHELFDILRIKITSANELTKTQIDKIKDFFEKKLNKKIDVEWNIDKNQIAGLKIQLNNKIYTNTVRSKLNVLKKELLSRREENYAD